MKLYTFAALAILAITMAPVPQTQAGILGNLLGNVVNTTTNVLNTAGNIVQQILLGGDRLPPNGKIATLRCSEGKIIGHLSGDFVTLVEKFTTQAGEEIFFHVANNNTEVIVTNKSGTELARLTGPDAQGIINLALQLKGQFSLCVNHLGKVENGVQTIVDAKGQDIDTVTQSDVNVLPCGLTIVGKTLSGLVQNIPGLIDGISLSVRNLVGGILNGFGIINSVIANAVGGVVNGVSNSVGDIVNGLQNVVGGVDNATIGGIENAQFPLVGDLVTLRDPSGNIIGHINGDLVPLAKILTALPFEKIYFKQTLSFTEFVVADKNGMILRLLKSNGRGIVNVAFKFDGPISMTLSHLGNVENGVQTISNGDGEVVDKVIDKMTYSNVLPCGLTIVGKTLSDLIQQNPGLIDDVLMGEINRHD